MLNIDDKRVILNPKFKKELFEQLYKKHYKGHGSITKICNLLNIKRQLFYLYRKNYTTTIPLIFVYKIGEILDKSEEEIKNNIKDIYNYREIRDDILNKGIKLRHNKLKKFKTNIPLITNLIKKDYINLELWFNSYINLINFGSRQFIKINKKENKIILKYTNYSNSKKKLFINFLPKKIKIDEDFLYFFGLWCGDRSGRGRFGIVNKNKEINFFTKYYLNKLYQKNSF